MLLPVLALQNITLPGRATNEFYRAGYLLRKRVSGAQGILSCQKFLLEEIFVVYTKKKLKKRKSREIFAFLWFKKFQKLEKKIFQDCGGVNSALKRRGKFKF